MGKSTLPFLKLCLVLTSCFVTLLALVGCTKVCGCDRKREKVCETGIWASTQVCVAAQGEKHRGNQAHNTLITLLKRQTCCHSIHCIITNTLGRLIGTLKKTAEITVFKQVFLNAPHRISKRYHVSLVRMLKKMLRYVHTFRVNHLQMVYYSRLCKWSWASRKYFT